MTNISYVIVQVVHVSKGNFVNYMSCPEIQCIIIKVDIWPKNCLIFWLSEKQMAACLTYHNVGRYSLSVKFSNICSLLFGKFAGLFFTLFIRPRYLWVGGGLSQAAIQKHRKNCECCPRHSLFKSHNVIVNIVVLNCQKCNQCHKCQVSGHKSLVLLIQGVL